MNQELLIRLAHYLYSDFNVLYSFVSNQYSKRLLLAVGQAFNRLYHQTASEADLKLLNSVCCNDTSCSVHGVACEACEANPSLPFVANIEVVMAKLLLKVLNEKGYHPEKIQTYAEVLKHISPAELKSFNQTLISKVKKYFPLPSLESLSAKVIAENKALIGPEKISVSLPSAFFAKYPAMEVDADRLVKSMLSRFLLQYKPESLEAKLFSCLTMLSAKPEGLYNAVHQLLKDTDYKNYNAYLAKHFSKPIIAAMKAYRGQPEKFMHAIREFLKKYEPHGVETICFKYLLAFEKKDVCSEVLRQLVSSEALKDKMNEHLLNTLHAPLVAIIHAHDNLSPKISK